MQCPHLDPIWRRMSCMSMAPSIWPIIFTWAQCFVWTSKDRQAENSQLSLRLWLSLVLTARCGPLELQSVCLDLILHFSFKSLHLAWAVLRLCSWNHSSPNRFFNSTCNYLQGLYWQVSASASRKASRNSGAPLVPCSCCTNDYSLCMMLMCDPRIDCLQLRPEQKNLALPPPIWTRWKDTGGFWHRGSQHCTADLRIHIFKFPRQPLKRTSYQLQKAIRVASAS